MREVIEVKPACFSAVQGAAASQWGGEGWTGGGAYEWVNLCQWDKHSNTAAHQHRQHFHQCGQLVIMAEQSVFGSAD